MINLTPDARVHFKAMLDKNSNAIYIGVKKTGCSGLSYVLELAIAPRDDCDEYIIDDLKIIINKEHLPYLNNLTINYIKDTFGGHIKFINPNSKGECGCGESFTTS